MMVKLTSNILPEENLNSGARGIVMVEGGYHSHTHPIVMVDFKEYTGPPLCGTLPRTWVPIVAKKVNCECGLYCSRIGTPLQVCKADTVHSFQGATVGAKEPIERLVLLWDSRAESNWPGILYVGGSRAQEEEDIALKFNITSNAINKIGTSASWKKQDAEVNDIYVKAMARRREMERQGRGTEQHYVTQIKALCASVLERVNAGHVLPQHVVEVTQCANQWTASVERWEQSFGAQ